MAAGRRVRRRKGDLKWRLDWRRTVAMAANIAAWAIIILAFGRCAT